MIKNGRKVDPLKIKAATGTNLAGNELKRFKQEAAKIAAITDELNGIAANEANPSATTAESTALSADTAAAPAGQGVAEADTNANDKTAALNLSVPAAQKL